MTLKQTYRKSPEATISFDWVDFAEGTGIVLLYGAGTADSAGTKYILTRNKILSEVKQWFQKGGFVVDTPTMEKSISFDQSPFNSPRTMRGTMTVTIPALLSDLVSNQVKNHYFKIYVRKVDLASQVVEIANVQTSTDTQAAGTVSNKSFTAKLTIPRIHFKAGEILRVSIEWWVWVGGNGAWGQGGFAFEPKNNDTQGDDDAAVWSGSGEPLQGMLEVHTPFDLGM